MVNITIDNRSFQVEDNCTIKEAAKKLGIEIPSLCFLKDINEIAACRVCVVEVEGIDRLVTACNNKVEENMVIYTNTPRVRQDRLRTVQMILSQHDCKCATCVRSGNCSLQKLSNDLNISENIFREDLEIQKWNKDFPLVRNSSKCIKCIRCIQVCDKVQSLNIWELEATGRKSTVNVSGLRSIEESDCSLCGQCITHCPVGALSERDDTEKFWKSVYNPKKTVVVQIAPAVRTAWAEETGIPRGEATVGLMYDALKKMGADYVFDTSFSADLTIMEEAYEFLDRFKSKSLGERPMFTSCCPGWIRFIKSQYPHLVPNLSTAKSPMQMFGSIIKTYFAEKLDKRPEDIVYVAIMPCLAKKGEVNMDFFDGEFAGHETDISLTTREFVRMMRSSQINIDFLENIEPDRLFHDYSGAGVIFGSTGGVMEAALRTAYYEIMGENPPLDAFEVVRANSKKDGLVEANFKLKDIDLKIGVVSGLSNTRKLLEDIEAGRKKFDFVEVMACPGGCVGGGGQPIHDGQELAYERSLNLYFLDDASNLRYSHENEDIKRLYKDFIERPNSPKAHRILHTDHNNWVMHKAPKKNRNGYVLPRK